MNFKKILSIATVASVAVVGLASCGGKEEAGLLDDVEDYQIGGNINLALNYNGAAYLTYGRATGVTLPETYTTVDGKTLVKGQTITPVWQDIASNMGVTFTDTALEGTSTSTMMKAVIDASYKGLNGANVDMLQIGTGDDFTDACNAGGFVNLMKYKKYLPNLFNWLDEHQSVKEQMIQTIDGVEGIYYTPYFDGVDQIEKGFNMNVQMVEALLDDDVASTNVFKNATDYDTATTLSAVYGTTNALPGGQKSYIEELSEQEIVVYNSNTGKSDTIEVTFDEDVVTRQNNLTTKNGKTLTEELKNYIDDVYGDYIGEGKIYSKRSEIFTSSSACYNADELIALCRCVKTNPNYLTGNASMNMVPIFPRTGEYNRASIFFELSQMFGLRGTNGESSRYWINENGELVSTMSQDYALDCIEKMNALQNEGLFPTSEHWFLDNNAKGDYRKQLQYGSCFMTYDYYNVAAYNAEFPGRDASTWMTKDMQAVLSPVAMWPVTKDDNGKKLSTATNAGYSYIRFSEDNRSLKNGGWSICSTVETGSNANLSKLKKCLEMIDYLYTEEGSFLECYGVNYQDANGTKGTDSNGVTFSNALCDEIITDGSGTRYPKLSTDYVNEIATVAGGTWHNYMTRYLGSCMGVGNIRSNYLESQNTGGYQTVGMTKISEALGCGAMYMCTTGGSNFYRSVNTSLSFTTEQATDNKNGETLTNWWNISKNKETNGWTSDMLLVVEKGWSASTTLNSKSAVKDAFAGYNNSVLKNAANVWGFGVKYATSNQYSFIR